jgi:hypothetical protein
MNIQTSSATLNRVILEKDEESELHCHKMYTSPWKRSDVAQDSDLEKNSEVDVANVKFCSNKNKILHNKVRVSSRCYNVFQQANFGC